MKSTCLSSIFFNKSHLFYIVLIGFILYHIFKRNDLKENYRSKDKLSWTRYGACSEPCGSGEKTRELVCKPGGGRSKCLPSNIKKMKIKKKACNKKACKPSVIGKWEEWPLCSESDTPGFQTRTRECERGTKKMPCKEEVSETRTCDESVMGEWDEWPLCDETGIQTRKRTCTRGTDDLPCRGELSEKRECALPKMSKWGNWDTCTNKVQKRERTCTPGSEGFPCKEELSETRECTLPNMSDWKDWSLCTNKVQKRERTCTPGSEGFPCKEELSETRTCSPSKLKDWSKWSLCPNDDTSSFQTRSRKCELGTDNLPCEGVLSEKRRCNPNTTPLKQALSKRMNDTCEGVGDKPNCHNEKDWWKMGHLLTESDLNTTPLKSAYSSRMGDSCSGVGDKPNCHGVTEWSNMGHIYKSPIEGKTTPLKLTYKNNDTCLGTNSKLKCNSAKASDWNTIGHICKYPQCSSTPPSKEIDGYTLHDGQDMAGGDMSGKQYSGVDRRWCANKCDTTPGCKSITTRESDKGCWIKNEIKPLTPKDGLVSYTKKIQPSKEIDGYTLHDGQDMAGGDMSGKQYSGVDRRWCANKCDTTPGCKSITTRESDKRCWLKNTVPAKTPKDGLVSYTKKITPWDPKGSGSNGNGSGSYSIGPLKSYSDGDKYNKRGKNGEVLPCVWSHLHRGWTTCSATCGPGTQKLIVGGIGPRNGGAACDPATRPEDQEKVCNQGPCEETFTCGGKSYKVSDPFIVNYLKVKENHCTPNKTVKIPNNHKEWHRWRCRYNAKNNAGRRDKDASGSWCKETKNATKYCGVRGGSILEGTQINYPDVRIYNKLNKEGFGCGPANF
jgi:hypothetical protein